MRCNVGRVSKDLGPRKGGMMDQPLGFMPPLFPDEWFYRPLGIDKGNDNDALRATHRVANHFYGPREQRTPLTEVVE